MSTRKSHSTKAQAARSLTASADRALAPTTTPDFAALRRRVWYGRLMAPELRRL